MSHDPILILAGADSALRFLWAVLRLTAVALGRAKIPLAFPFGGGYHFGLPVRRRSFQGVPHRLGGNPEEVGTQKAFG